MSRKQLNLELKLTGRGGWRPGAGRPRGGAMRHVSRHEFPGRCPLIVTVRVLDGIPRLRCGRFVRAFRQTLAQACIRSGFRVVHYSIQQDHVHFLIEADGQQALANGMKSVGSRLGKVVNRVFGRKGRVIKERFHHRVMRTPRDVRNGLRYVLLNARKHYKKDHGQPPPVHLDEASSGRWFTGWRVRPPPSDEEPRIRDVATARTWLLTKGWRLPPQSDRPGRGADELMGQRLDRLTLRV